MSEVKHIIMEEEVKQEKTLALDKKLLYLFVYHSADGHKSSTLPTRVINGRHNLHASARKSWVAFISLKKCHDNIKAKHSV